METQPKKPYFFESSGFRKILYVILALVVLLLTFRTGMLLGYQKAVFSFQAGQNYQEIFLGPQHPPGFNLGNDDFFNDHGIVGQIMQINGDTIVIKSNDEIEKSVLTSTTTLIKKFQNTITIDDLKPDDQIVVIGSPNTSGQIEAKLIRYLAPPNSPPPGGDGSTTPGN